MKRMHIHVGVDNIEESVKFYSALFGVKPVKQKPDYAKWMLDDPRVNFAISTRSGKKGLDHLGFQVDDDAELEQMREQLRAADIALFNEGETICCYARSDKSWLRDPAGIAWEAYQTMADAQLFSATESAEEGSACCTPTAAVETASAPAACNSASDNKTSGCC